MTGPLGIKFAVALYQITARGDRRETIDEDDEDRELFFGVLAETVGRFSWTCHACWLITNHYRLVMVTVEPDLTKRMRHLNWVFSGASSRHHARMGRLSQGRLMGILVDKDAYLLELSRYVVRNPAGADVVVAPDDWPWSSYRAMIGAATAAPCPAVDGMLSLLRRNGAAARKRYGQFVLEAWVSRSGMGYGSRPILGTTRLSAKVELGADKQTVPRGQRGPPPAPLSEDVPKCGGRNQAILEAHATGAYTCREIAEYFRIHLAIAGGVRRAMQ